MELSTEKQIDRLLYTPLNLKRWIDQYRDRLRPPVSNKMIWKDRQFIIMAVGGPNARPDYHINSGEEFFYQIEGDMLLKVRIQNKFEDIVIKEGEIFLLPPNIPHSPQRFKNTIGLVIEKKRDTQDIDSLVWYCQSCEGLIDSKSFHLVNIETQIKEAIEDHFSDKKNYTCQKCGRVNAKN